MAEHGHGHRTNSINWPAPGEEPVVADTILDNTIAAKSAAQRLPREPEAKIGTGIWMWLQDVLGSDNGQMGVAGVCNPINEWRSR
jgi:hypothetical protein